MGRSYAMMIIMFKLRPGGTTEVSWGGQAHLVVPVPPVSIKDRSL
jgi:hypothetical protein